MKEKPMKVNWVKRLGQAHHQKAGVTLCGMPCLGNNYEGRIPKQDYKYCDKCQTKWTQLHCEHKNPIHQPKEPDTGIGESYTCDDCGVDLDPPEFDEMLYAKEADL